jgi:hypothetical protein
MRYEYQEGFDVRGYNPAAKNGLVLTRIMLDFNLRIADRARAFLQLRDARAVWSRGLDKMILLQIILRKTGAISGRRLSSGCI